MNEWMPCSNLKRKSPGNQKKKKVRRVDYRRVLTRLLYVVLIFLAGILIVRKTVRPFVLCISEGRNASEISRELRQIEAENVRLAENKSYLESKEGALTEARKLGWVIPGERGIIIENGPKINESKLPPGRKDSGFMNSIKKKLRI